MLYDWLINTSNWLNIIQIITNAVVFVILLIATFDTLGSFLIARGFITRKNKFLWTLFYNNNEEELIENVLRKLGFSKKEVINTASHLGKRKIIENNEDERLISLIYKYIMCFSEKVTYGVETPVPSHYYINTMEASHNKEDLELMCRLINKLITNDSVFPDFVITPKSGNPIMGKEFAEFHNIVSIFRKSNYDKSKARFIPSASNELAFNVNYEGSLRLNSLIEELKKYDSRDRKIHGIVIDCNASGASEILKTMEEFNSHLSEGIDPIVEAYILFRPDVASDVDEKFSERGFKLNRYFDLNDDIKTKIHLYKTEKSKAELDIDNKQDWEFINEILCDIKNAKLYKK